MSRLSYRPRKVRLLSGRGGGTERSKLAAQPKPVAQRARIAYDTRLFVWKRDGGRCTHCGAASDLQFDHVIPESLGGAGIAANVELLCGPCNRQKSARLFVPGGNERR